MRLRGKVAFITGAASGIGRATAKRFAEEGARLALLDINDRELRSTLAAVHSMGVDAIAVAGDISSAQDVRRAIAEATATFGRLDVLDNSAGILLLGRDVPVADLSEDIRDKVVAVNLTGTFLACKYAIPEMIRSGGGSIINIASIAAFHGWHVTGAYGASKGGVVALTRDIAKAYARHNIRANTICPGNLDTAMTAPLSGDADWQMDIEATPLKRLGRPEEIANVALFLASDESSFLTGEAIVADGGFTA